MIVVSESYEVKSRGRTYIAASLAEAGWMKALLTADTKFDHEPFVIQTSVGFYRPDFFLHHRRVIFEVKNGNVDEKALTKLKEAGELTGCAIAMVNGSWWLDGLKVNKGRLVPSWNFLSPEWARQISMTHSNLPPGRPKVASEAQKNARHIELLNLPTWVEYAHTNNIPVGSIGASA